MVELIISKRGIFRGERRGIIKMRTFLLSLSPKIYVYQMKKFGVIIFFCLAALGVSAQWNTTNMLRVGKSAIMFDDYVSAIENFNNIIRIKPYLSEPYFFRGLAKLNLDDFEGAIRDYTKAIELNPNYFHAYMYRGIAYHNMKRYEEAMHDYNTAIAINPGEAYAYANRAITEADMGDYKAAEKDYSKALIIDKNLLPAYLNRAIMREKLGDQEGAIADCNMAIKLNMFSDDAYGLRGYLRFQAKEYHDAIEDYNKALKINPENKRILMSRAITWYEMKKYPEALEDYTAVLKVDSTYAYAYYNRALLRSEIGDVNNAIQDFDQVLEMNPDNILIYFNRGLLKMEIKDYEGAYNDFSQSISIYPDFVKAYLARAATSMDMRDYDAAEKDRYKAEEIMDRYRRMKDGDQNALVDTTENFKRLIDINSRDDRMKDVINGRLQDRNVIIELQDMFIVQYLSLDTLRKGKVQYFDKRIMKFNQEHNYNPALTVSNKKFNYPREFEDNYIESLSSDIRKNKNVTDALLLRGSLYLNRGDYTKAIEDFRAVLERDPNHLFALMNLASARSRMYDYIESIEEKTSRVVGEEKKVERNVDYSLVLEGNNKCLEIDPEFVFAMFNIANVYAKSGEIQKAIDMYTKVLEVDKDIAEAYFNRGLLYIYQGNRSAANVDLSKAGELGLTDSYSIIKRYCSVEEE